MEIGEIRQACHQLPEDLSWRPAPFVAALLFPLIALSLKKEAAVDTESAVDSTVGTVFYPAEDGARDLIDSKFSARNQKQKGCFLQPDSHHLSKYHGKLKTKYDRMLMGVNYLNELAKHYFAMKDAGVSMLHKKYVSEFVFARCTLKGTDLETLSGYGFEDMPQQTVV
jgi:hypothetical protein